MTTTSQVTTTHTLEPVRAQPAAPDRAPAFDWIMALLGLWFEGGLFVDLWAHSHGRVDDTFFTPWHGMFYSGFAAIALAMIAQIVRARQAGAKLIPAGYEGVIPAFLLFTVSGVADLLWHSINGFDLASDAPINPSHMGLTIAIALIVSAPLRAEWRREVTSPRVPALLAWIALLSMVTLAVQFAHPTAKVWASPQIPERYPTDPVFAQSLAISGMLLLTVIWVGFVLALLRKWRLWPGFLTLGLTANAALMSLSYDEYRLIPAAVGAGLAVEGIVYLLRGRASQARRYAAVALPAVYFSLYFLIVHLTTGTWWQPHVWSGALVFCACAGWLISAAMDVPGNCIPRQDK